MEPATAHHQVTADTRTVSDINCGTINRNPKDMSFRALVGEDFATHGNALFSQGFWTLFWHRFGNWRMDVRPRALRAPFTLLYRLGAKASEWFCGMDLPYTVVVGRRVRLEHFGGMILIARSIGDDVIIRQNTTFGIASTTATHGRPTIGDRVDIGAGAVLVGDITIGADTHIGANAVVTKSHPSGVVLAGVPARVIGRRSQPVKR
ncbi:MAG: transferase [Pseudomonadota bacterium]